jgi:hypothetical protein
VLRAAGFHDGAIEAISYYNVVHLRSRSPFPIVAKSSDFQGSILERDEVRTIDGRPTIVMTYRKGWLATIVTDDCASDDLLRLQVPLSPEDRIDSYKEVLDCKST